MRNSSTALEISQCSRTLPAGDDLGAIAEPHLEPRAIIGQERCYVIHVDHVGAVDADELRGVEPLFDLLERNAHSEPLRRGVDVDEIIRGFDPNDVRDAKRDYATGFS